MKLKLISQVAKDLMLVFMYHVASPETKLQKITRNYGKEFSQIFVVFLTTLP